MHLTVCACTDTHTLLNRSDCPRVANISVVTQFLSSSAAAMECHGERVSGAAKRRRERRLRQWHRHERLTVQMALCEALHHAAPQVERGENSVPRGQKTHIAGGRPGVLGEPEPPVGVVRAMSPRIAAPSLATPLLAGQAAEVIDPSSLRFLAASALAVRRKERGGGEEGRGEAHGDATPSCRRHGKGTVASGAGRQEEEEEKETSSNFLFSFLSLGSTAGTCSCVSLRGRSSTFCLLQQWIHVLASVLEAFRKNSTLLREGPCFLCALRYPAVTCSVSASPEEYKRTGISGRRLHIFLQPLVSGSHLFSVSLACGTGKLVSLGDDFFYDPVYMTVTCSVRLRLRVQVPGFIWELTSGYSFRIHHTLVRQRIHVSVSPLGCGRISHVFLRVLGPRIPRSIPGAVHTWKSGVLPRAPHIWQPCQSMVAFGRIPRISFVKMTLDPKVWLREGGLCKSPYSALCAHTVHVKVDSENPA